MAAFDFITNEEFRASLEAYQAELHTCVVAKAWKAVHVLAGSIIEAVLLDYLIASDYQNLPPEELLKFDLNKAIDACQAEGVLTAKTAQLSAVIKDYRNLIHPGRSVRLSERVDENTAQIVQALLAMILTEVAKKKSERWGNTAEQLTNKLLADPSGVGILDHLLQGMKELEIERLLLKVLPEQYFLLLKQEPAPEERLVALRQCFHRTFGKASVETKKKVVERHVKILREDGEVRVLSYADAFVRLNHPHATNQQQEQRVIKDHLLARLGRNVTEPLLEALEGIGRLLTTQDLPLFLWPLLSEFAVGKDEKRRQKVKEGFRDERFRMNTHILAEAKKVIDSFITRFQQENYGQDAVDKAREMRAVLDAPQGNRMKIPGIPVF